MSSVQKWKAGDVAEVTMRHMSGEERSWSPCMYDTADRGWVSSDSGRLYGDTGVWKIVRVRPLAVIDPEDREQVERLESLLTDAEVAVHDGHPCLSRSCHIDQVQAALREFANPVVKPEEPTGLGAVVFAECECSPDRKRFVRDDTGSDFPDDPWKSVCGHHKWSDLDVRDADDVLQKGLTD